MNAQAVIDEWGIEGLVRWDREVVDRTALPETAKGFLTDVGIPGEMPFGWVMEWDGELAQIPANGVFLKLGAEPGHALVLDESRDGAVCSLGLVAYDALYMNASVEKFVMCLLAYKRLLEAEIAVEDPEAPATLRRFSDSVLAIDESIAGEPESFWQCTCQEMIVRAELSQPEA